MKTSDVLIVGAGPAGAAAATVLARAGRSVVLADRATFPRDKTCGDGLTTGALRRLEHIGVTPGCLPSFTTVDALTVRSPSGRIIDLPLPDRPGCYGAVAKRSDLDAALVDVARTAGADLWSGARLEELSAGGEAVDAAFSNGEHLRARFVIGADGARSTVRRFTVRDETPSPKAGFYAYRAYATRVKESAMTRLWVLFEPNLLPGYAWAFPLGRDTMNVGLCLRRAPHEAGGLLAAAWRALLVSPFVRSLLGPAARLESPARAWPIPVQLGHEVAPLGGRVLLVGDAAGAADPMTGEGIGQALETGADAANAIITAGGDPEKAKATYLGELRRGLRLDHSLANICASMLSSPVGARLVVAGTGAREGIARNVARWLYEDYPRSIVLSSSHWRKAVLDVPGPFAGSQGFSRLAP